MMYKAIVYTNKTSGGRRPCVWKICSKPLINKSKDDTNNFPDWIKELSKYSRRIGQKMYKVKKGANYFLI